MDKRRKVDLKRILFGFSLLCILICIYFYWNQSASLNTPKFTLTYQHLKLDKSKKTTLPKWTWQCINQRCERHHISNANVIPVVSLLTCNMLCGSTQLWPQPTGRVILGSRPASISHQQIVFKTSAHEPAKTLLQQVFSYFNDTILNLVENVPESKTNQNLKKLLIIVRIQHSDKVHLKLATNESYTLVVKTKKDSDLILVNITAFNYFGARHGLETLSQLIWWNEILNCLQILKAASIQDGPNFPYRGVMVDTARNFMSIESLKRVIIGMAANKLNVLHWHITDSQSFPIILPQVPQLAASGAYSPEMVYTPDEVRAFVDFARLHGIRVFLEIDMPAHAGNGWTWGLQAGLGELAVCVNKQTWSSYCGEPPCGQLNPDNPHVYNILEMIYKDILDLTQENEIFHLGGDEVNLECWAEHLQSARLLNYTDLHDLWGDFTLKALKRLTAANNNVKIPYVIVWSSNLSKRPYINKYFDQKQIVFQSWGASQWPDTSDLITDDYRVIISHVDAWYLDCGFGNWRERGAAACDPYRTWQTVYNHRPWQQFHSSRLKQILGGEVCVWSEQFDELGLDNRLWPRAAAFAERVWSDSQLSSNTYTVEEDVYTRLSTQSERMKNRGIGVAAIWPLWCTQNPGMCL